MGIRGVRGVLYEIKEIDKKKNEIESLNKKKSIDKNMESDIIILKIWEIVNLKFNRKETLV